MERILKAQALGNTSQHMMMGSKNIRDQSDSFAESLIVKSKESLKETTVKNLTANDNTALHSDIHLKNYQTEFII